MQTQTLFGLQFRLLLSFFLDSFYFHLSALFCVSSFFFLSCLQYFNFFHEASLRVWKCKRVPQQDRFVSDLDKSGQTYELVSFLCQQHIIPSFTQFFFYPSRKADDRQNKCNAQAVDMNSDPSPAATYSLYVFTCIRNDGRR